MYFNTEAARDLERESARTMGIVAPRGITTRAFPPLENTPRRKRSGTITIVHQSIQHDVM